MWLLLLACAGDPKHSAAPDDTAPTGGDTAPDSADTTETGDSADTTDSRDTSDTDDPPDTDDSAHTGDSADTGRPDGLATGPFVIGFWCGPPASELTAARFAEMAAAGITRASNACDGTTYTPAYNLTMLDLAAAAGLDVVVTDSRGLAAGQGSDVSGNVAGLVADYGGHPALAGYHVYDEPGAGAFGALAAVVDAVAAADPAHLVSMNLFPDYASAAQLGTSTYDSYVAGFLDTVGPEFFTYDHYNFLSDGSDGPTFFQNLASVRAAALARGVPWGQYIQSISYTGHRATNGPEKRWAAMHTLAYGGTGVYYFTWWTPPQTSEAFGDGIIRADGTASSQYADVADINADIGAMLPVLAGARSTSVFHNGELALGTVPRTPGEVVYIPSAAPITVGTFQTGGDTLALLVNRDHVNTTNTDVYVAAGAGGVLAMDTGTGSFVPLSGSTDGYGTRLSIALAPGDGLLLHLPGPLPTGPVGAEAYYGSVRSDAGWLDVVDGRYGTTRLRTAGWYDCPAGTTLIGSDFQSNGFWLCAPEAYAGRTFWVGNVVSDYGWFYRVSGGTTVWKGGAGWDTCPTGSLVGHRFDSNGYWVCME